MYHWLLIYNRHHYFRKIYHNIQIYSKLTCTSNSLLCYFSPSYRNRHKL